MDNQEWLSSLKVGDKVAYDTGRYGATMWEVDAIEKITPKRNMVTGKGYSFNSDGICRVDSRNFYNLKPITDDVIEWIKRRNLLNKIQKIKFDTLSNDKLEQLYKLISQWNYVVVLSISPISLRVEVDKNGRRVRHTLSVL